MDEGRSHGNDLTAALLPQTTTAPSAQEGASHQSPQQPQQQPAPSRQQQESSPPPSQASPYENTLCCASIPAPNCLVASLHSELLSLLIAVRSSQSATPMRPRHELFGDTQAEELCFGLTLLISCVSILPMLFHISLREFSLLRKNTLSVISNTAQMSDVLPDEWLPAPEPPPQANGSSPVASPGPSPHPSRSFSNRSVRCGLR